MAENREYRKWIDRVIGQADQDVLKKMQNTHYDLIDGEFCLL